MKNSVKTSLGSKKMIPSKKRVLDNTLDEINYSILVLVIIERIMNLQQSRDNYFHVRQTVSRQNYKI